MERKWVSDESSRHQSKPVWKKICRYLWAQILVGTYKSPAWTPRVAHAIHQGGKAKAIIGRASSRYVMDPFRRVLAQMDVF